MLFYDVMWHFLKRFLNWLYLLVLWLGFVCLITFSAASFWHGANYRWDIIAQFRVQYLIGWVVFGLFCLLVRRWKLAGVSVVFIGVIGVSVSYPVKVEEAVEDKPAYSLVSFNLYMGNKDESKILAMVDEEDADFVFFIETAHLWRSVIEPMKKRYAYHLVRYGWTENGVALFSKYPLTVRQDAVTRAIAVANLPEGEVLLIGCHPKAPRNQKDFTERNEYLAGVAHYVQEQTLPTIVLGDLNCAPWAPSLKNLFSETELTLANGSWIPSLTWPVGMPWLWVPIDHFWYQGGLRVVEQVRLSSRGSDHYPIKLSFQLELAQ